MKPLPNKLLIKKIEQSNKLDSGIIITNDTNLNAYVGEILEVGNKITDLDKGMKIVYNFNLAHDIPENVYPVENCVIIPIGAVKRVL